MPKAHHFFFRIVLGLAIALPFAACQSGGSCDASCNDYNSILVNCNHDAPQQDVYNSCVCNSDNFTPYVDECIACTGDDSAPAKFKNTCNSVPPDCNLACQGFGLTLKNCGDTSDPGFRQCVCSGAYDAWYTNTFNQDFQGCATCENGGGQAAQWEAYCCELTKNCNGMSPEASAALASGSVQPTGTGTNNNESQPSNTSTSESTGTSNNNDNSQSSNNSNDTGNLGAIGRVDRRMIGLGVALCLFIGLA